MRKAVLFLLLVFSVVAAQADNPKGKRLAHAAESLTAQHVVYDPAYFTIPYSNGDVPAGKGVCTDVVIRAYRKLGIDLQKLVHEDMQQNFKLYPKKWGLKNTDKNIDHRRVPNLMVFFRRRGLEIPITDIGMDYLPGDIVCWDLGDKVTHIGIISNRLTPDKKRYQMVHNIGAGQVLEDCLFQYRVIGHYQYQER